MSDSRTHRNATPLSVYLRASDRLFDEAASFDTKTRIVGLAIAKMLNRDDQGRLSAWPGRARLGRMTKLSKKSVERATAALCAGPEPIYRRKMAATTRRKGKTYEPPTYTYYYVEAPASSQPSASAMPPPPVATPSAQVPRLAASAVELPKPGECFSDEILRRFVYGSERDERIARAFSRHANTCDKCDRKAIAIASGRFNPDDDDPDEIRRTPPKSYGARFP